MLEKDSTMSGKKKNKKKKAEGEVPLVLRTNWKKERGGNGDRLFVAAIIEGNLERDVSAGEEERSCRLSWEGPDSLIGSSRYSRMRYRTQNRRVPETPSE